MEDALTNRELMDFADVIDEANAPFWKEQILRNRKGALDALAALRAKVRTEAAPTEAPRMIPLRNRLAAIERTVSTVSEPAAPARAGQSIATAIRNRAHEIAKAERIPFMTAFARAETELAKE